MLKGLYHYIHFLSSIFFLTARHGENIIPEKNNMYGFLAVFLSNTRLLLLVTIGFLRDNNENSVPVILAP